MLSVPPSRLIRPVPLIVCRSVSSFRLSCLPVLRVGWRGVGRDGRGLVGKSGSSGGWLLGRCGSVLSWSWSVCLFHCISFRCGFRYRDGCFRASRLLVLCSFSSHFVRFRPLLCVLISLRVGFRPVSRPVWLVGASVRRRSVDCLPVPRWGCGVGDVVSISSRSAYRLFDTASVEAVMSGVPSCLLGGVDDVMC